MTGEHFADQPVTVKSGPSPSPTPDSAPPRPTRHSFWERFVGRHDWQVAWHSGPDLWCNVGYECAKCPARKEVHEDHWADRHNEQGL